MNSNYGRLLFLYKPRGNLGPSGALSVLCLEQALGTVIALCLIELDRP
jgi:hypothetical protein